MASGVSLLHVARMVYLTDVKLGFIAVRRVSVWPRETGADGQLFFPLTPDNASSAVVVTRSGKRSHRMLTSDVSQRELRVRALTERFSLHCRQSQVAP